MRFDGDRLDLIIMDHTFIQVEPENVPSTYFSESFMKWRGGGGIDIAYIYITQRQQ
jgi:hypothetical protein